MIVTTRSVKVGTSEYNVYAVHMYLCEDEDSLTYLEANKIGGLCRLGVSKIIPPTCLMESIRKYTEESRYTYVPRMKKGTTLDNLVKRLFGCTIKTTKEGVKFDREKIPTEAAVFIVRELSDANWWTAVNFWAAYTDSTLPSYRELMQDFLKQLVDNSELLEGLRL